ncbi:hypothetical protein THUN1379_05730 [Paludibacterium sp. THUN1379]|nr:hypothetical protein THUN1379_05730 [Paludibacterium sp. THUN1379]
MRGFYSVIKIIPNVIDMVIAGLREKGRGPHGYHPRNPSRNRVYAVLMAKLAWGERTERENKKALNIQGLFV